MVQVEEVTLEILQVKVLTQVKPVLLIQVVAVEVQVLDLLLQMIKLDQVVLVVQEELS